MALFDLSHVTFTYPQAPEPTLRDVSLSFDRGEFTVLCGLNGSGKTTLLRCLKTVLAPHGDLSGEIVFDGVPLPDIDLRQQASRIAFVLQDPNAQTVCETVGEELAFALENVGVEHRSMHVRVAETATFFNLQDRFDRSIDTLSGGQRQILNLAAAMTLRPDVVVLDEPTSQLDPIAAQEFLTALTKVNRELGVAVIMCEQRIADVLPHADRVVVMEDGAVALDGTPHDVAPHLASRGSALAEALPEPLLIHRAVAPQDAGCDAPLSVRDGRLWLDRAAAQATPLQVPALPLPADACVGRPVAIDIRNVRFRYSRTTPDILKGMDLTVHRGTIHALLGGNGVGKSTLLKAIAGLHRPYRGSIAVHGGERLTDAPKSPEVVMLPQNPGDIFVKERIIDDLEAIAGSYGISDPSEAIARAAEECGIAGYIDHHPYDVSGGELQRAAFAAVLLGSPSVLLLDEPTKAVDAGFKTALARLLHRIAQRGTTIVFATHDLRFSAEHADVCTLMFDGTNTATGTPHEIFTENMFYTTEANRMCRDVFPGAITVEDVVALCKENGVS